LPDLATTILLIDGNDHEHTYYADRLKCFIPDCVVLEAKDEKSALKVYKSRRVDCIVHEIFLPDWNPSSHDDLELFERYGFGEIIVHACLPTLLTVSRHGVRGDGDDGKSLASVCPFVHSDHRCCLPSIHLGHLAIHQDQRVPDSSDRVDRFEPVGHDIGPVAELFQLTHHDFLVHDIILCHEDAGP